MTRPTRKPFQAILKPAQRTICRKIKKHYFRNDQKIRQAGERRLNRADFLVDKKTYSDAIEYTGIARGTRGLIIFAGLIASSLGFWFGWRLILDSLRWGINGFISSFSVLCAIGSLIFGFYIAIKSVRLELFRPEDEPTIFDRKNRKVYRIYRETYSGWRGILRPWPVKTATFEWDLG